MHESVGGPLSRFVDEHTWLRGYVNTKLDLVMLEVVHHVKVSEKWLSDDEEVHTVATQVISVDAKLAFVLRLE